MSRFSRDPRHSSDDLAYGDYYERESNVGGGRWDPERFTRERERAERARAPALVERDGFEERDIYESPRHSRGVDPYESRRVSQNSFGGRRRESSVDEFYARESGRGAPAYFEERDKYVLDEKFAKPASRRTSGRYHEEEVDSFEGSPARGQMVPFERRRISIEKDYGPSPRRGPPRPGLLRRQSSLDTFDRKPLPRYGERIRESPETIVIPTHGRRRSSPRFVERDFEEFPSREPERHREEDIRAFREREISTVRRRRADSAVELVEKETFEIEEEEPEKPYPRKGKTKMPARLANKRAIIELGYPFEEEVYIAVR